MKGIKILVVDDSSFMRKSLKSILEKAGHEVVGTAKDGAEGHAMYKELNPDLVIMDITMQGVDGIEGAKRIKEYNPDAKILFMSLVDDEKIVNEAKDLGAVDFLGKRDHDKLFNIINKLSQQE